MLTRLFTNTNTLINNVIHHFHQKHIFFSPQLSLCGVQQVNPTTSTSSTINELIDSIFLFAAPKKRMSRSKKRMKTTIRDRLPLKANIIRDKRTGQMTLLHKLPFRWREHIPNLMMDHPDTTISSTPK